MRLIGIGIGNVGPTAGAVRSNVDWNNGSD